MRILVVEDDYISRTVLTRQMGKYGVCDVAVNGTEAVFAFEKAIDEDAPYNLICLDIMMPGIDGQEVLREIRKRELQLHRLDAVKIVMTTALGDKDNIMKSFKNQCDGYLVKPITGEKLEATMISLGFYPGSK
ncbi:response regulator [Myxococcota bacterium]|nr:response regulator [Myxococcota bacterium]MBU1381113.1 response regulator [Myxococcota bacterium]MBU1496530.1 response regulator [Myxococcota bacterium]